VTNFWNVITSNSTKSYSWKGYSSIKQSGSELHDMVQCISIVFSVSTAAAVTEA